MKHKYGMSFNCRWSGNDAPGQTSDYYTGWCMTSDKPSSIDYIGSDLTRLEEVAAVRFLEHGIDVTADRYDVDFIGGVCDAGGTILSVMKDKENFVHAVIFELMQWPEEVS